MTTNRFFAVSEKDRIASLDQLRGVAVLGILVMNIQNFSMPAAAYLNPTAYGNMDGLNRWVWIISHILASEKFMTIFSMLFGSGILLFTRRAEQKGINSAALHYRRMGWLLLFGMVHGYLLWSGDILVTYSLCGMVVFLFRDKQPALLVRIAFSFFLVPILLDLYFYWSMPGWPREVVQSAIESWQPGSGTIQQYLEVYRGRWLEQMELRVPDTLNLQTSYFISHSFWRVMAMMLLGMALFKWQVLSGVRSAGFYRRMAIAGLAGGIFLSGLGVILNFRHHWSLNFSMYLGSQYNYTGSVAVALGYIALVMLLGRSRGGRRIKAVLASVGRMAFSNYILMTFLCTILFYGNGAGLYGSVDRTTQVIIVLAIWLLLMIFSTLWLKWFRYGPLERIWRGLTYRRWR
jgi:uncharacterized protein